MRNRARTLGVVVVALALGACGGEQTVDQKRTEALAGRVDQLEKRLAAVERGVEPVERLRDESASLERRISVVETSLREVATRLAAPAPTPSTAPPTTTTLPAAGAPPGMPSGPAAWGGRVTREDRQERRGELRALTQEFRTRISRFRGQAGSPEQQQQIQDTLQWYREQRRAVLRGGGRTDQ